MADLTIIFGDDDQKRLFASLYARIVELEEKVMQVNDINNANVFLLSDYYDVMYEAVLGVTPPSMRDDSMPTFKQLTERANQHRIAAGQLRTISKRN